MSRQLDEAHEHLERLGVKDIEEYPEIVSGAADTDTREVYNQLLDAVETGRFDLVVVHEISRLSRLGPTEIHEFIQHCLEHDTGVEALDIGLKIHVDDEELQQTIYSMVARLMGDLAQIEHKNSSGYGRASAPHSPPESGPGGRQQGSSSRTATSALIRPSSYTSGRPSPVSTAVSRSRLSPATPASPSRRSGVSTKIGATSTSAAKLKTTASTRRSPTSVRWRIYGPRIPPSKNCANASSG
ncbi:recombinase family protein [Halorubrum ezzemoulense]|nr:recombinase family protein [Halorubrum ezzemoulense]MDB2226289.1 recombinase family protein [Halorubrum ezzemoulense]MDB2265204.1 recombinase family protein [Halorubrum ezzemoulense]MDB2272238.1 recombinase family protein [Halorubrum ezzemoulense]MDB2276381.1 recombinase family protein [Halorubrum ezzemoulense]MDB9302336.1 recombinase family protein [Halorubrum ezzemoulense]